MSTPTPRPLGYLLMFKNAGVETHGHLSPAEKAAYAQRWNDWYDGLARQGKARQGHPLALEGRLVTGAEGRVIDGPYAEAKEVVGGFIWLDVDSLDDATAIAKQCPGLPLGVDVEVRPLAPSSPVLDAVSARPCAE